MPVFAGLVKVAVGAVIGAVLARIALRIWPINDAQNLDDDEQHSVKSTA